jgi:hypothetical protein
MSDKIGDSQPTAQQVLLTAMPQSVILQAELADITNPVNDANLSGKQGGATVMCKMTTGGAYHLAIAQGGDAANSWIVYDGTDLVPNTVIVPA